MNKIKSLILGSAAGLAAIAGAQAADLPVKAKPVQYVKICSLYGAGFYYIPGTETCIKLGGYVQADVNFNGGNYDKPPWDNSGGTVVGNPAYLGNFQANHSRDAEFFTTRARDELNIDTRAATEYGVVRSFFAGKFEFSTGLGPSSGNLTTDYAFVQFAGFTLGKAVSGFQTPWGAYGANNNTSYLVGGYDNATGITQAAYTWQFGNGVSAQIGVEDNRIINRAPIFNAFGSPAISSSSFVNANFGGSAANTVGTGGNVSPDIVGNIRIDQAAFTAQVSGAVHNLHATYYGASELTDHPTDEWGFAIAGGLQLKTLPTGPGDKLSLDFTYTDGAPKYVLGGVTGNSFLSFGGSVDNPNSYQSFATAALFDGVYGAPGTSIEKTKVWGFRGGYVHNWSPTVETDVFGSYTLVDYNANASTFICNKIAGSTTVVFLTGSTCNPDFNIWQVGTRTAWTPVQNLTFSGEVLYTVLDLSHSGTVALGAFAFKPTALYDLKDQGMWTGNLRVRRTF